MNKNAYEIRLEVLSMAQSLVMDDYSRKYCVWERRDMSGNVKEEPPTFPSTEEILVKAEELYKFVEKK